MARGRITRLTPALQTAITTAVAVGVPFVQACILAGVSEFTGLEWLRRGADRDDRPSTPLYAQFAQAVTRAKAQDEARRLARLEQAGRGGAIVHEKVTTFADGKVLRETTYAPPDWRADAFYLERVLSERYGRKDRMDMQLKIERAASEIAEELGISAEALLQEAQQILREHS